MASVFAASPSSASAASPAATAARHCAAASAAAASAAAWAATVARSRASASLVSAADAASSVSADFATAASTAVCARRQRLGRRRAVGVGFRHPRLRLGQGRLRVNERRDRRLLVGLDGRKPLLRAGEIRLRVGESSYPRLRIRQFILRGGHLLRCRGRALLRIRQRARRGGQLVGGRLRLIETRLGFVRGFHNDLHDIGCHQYSPPSGGSGLPRCSISISLSTPAPIPSATGGVQWKRSQSPKMSCAFTTPWLGGKGVIGIEAASPLVSPVE